MTGRGIPMTQSVLASKQDALLSVSVPDSPAVVVLPAGEASVTMAAGEAAILTRIAEFAASYGRTHNYDDRSELFRLAREWRQEWRHKRHTT